MQACLNKFDQQFCKQVFMAMEQLLQSVDIFYSWVTSLVAFMDMLEIQHTHMGEEKVSQNLN